MPLTNPLSALQHKRLGLEPYGYVLVVAEEGEDRAAAARLLVEAAARVAGHGYRTVFVGDNATAAGWNDCLQQVASLAAAELTVFIRNARLVITNHRDIAVQALTYSRPCLSSATKIDPAALETSALSCLGNAPPRHVDISPPLPTPLNRSDRATPPSQRERAT